jgi:hypothetical protein
MHALVMALSIVVVALAAITLYAVAKKRMMLMSYASTVMIAILGTLQYFEGQSRWSAYLCFAAAAIGAVSIAVRLRRGERT